MAGKAKDSPRKIRRMNISFHTALITLKISQRRAMETRTIKI